MWLISRPEDAGRPQGLGLAAIAGLGFAGFYIFMKEAGSGTALWLAACSRGASLVVTAIITVAGKKFSPFYAKGAVTGALAGSLHLTAPALFFPPPQPAS